MKLVNYISGDISHNVSGHVNRAAMRSPYPLSNTHTFVLRSLIKEENIDPKVI